MLPEHKVKRSPINIAAVLVNVTVPPFIYLCVVSILSFGYHFSHPYGVWFIALLGAIPALLSFQIGSRVSKSGADPVWFNFTGFTCGLAFLGAAVFGDQNYWFTLQQYYAPEALKTYLNVDPSKTSGVELMDAGRVYFKEDSILDIDKGMAFTHYNTYCVAPIVKVNASLEFYDLWAVGVNCCSPDDPQFGCFTDIGVGPPATALGGGAAAERKALAIERAQRAASGGTTHNVRSGGNVRAGLRVVRDPEKLLWSDRGDEQLFYSLAVEMAEAAYNIKTNHPVFFHWTQDPDKLVTKNFQDGYKLWILGIGLHFGVNLAIIIGFLLIHDKKHH